MSGARPEDETNLLAGEYVLCALEGDEMRAVGQQAGADPRLDRAIADWERRLAPMLTAVEDVKPPEALWARIQQSAALAPVAAQAAQPASASGPMLARPPAGTAWPRPAAPRRVWPWKVTTGASLALAAGLAALVLLPARSPVQPMPGGREVALVATLTQPESPGDTRPDTLPQMANATGTATIVEPSPEIADQTRPAAHVTGFLAATWPDGTVVLTALSPVPVPSGKSLELWIQPPDAKAPKSLGLLPASGRLATLPAMPPAGTALSVTLEPPDGSPSGAPTGRVVYAGTLRPVRR